MVRRRAHGDRVAGAGVKALAVVDVGAVGRHPGQQPVRDRRGGVGVGPSPLTLPPPAGQTARTAAPAPDLVSALMRALLSGQTVVSMTLSGRA
jgi:hypothetical protein